MDKGQHTDFKQPTDKTIDSVDDDGRSPTTANNVHIQFGGFGTVIKFRFHYYLWSRGTDFNLVALSAAKAALTRLLIRQTEICTNVSHNHENR